MRTIKFRCYDRKLKKIFPVHRMDWDKINDEMTFLSGVDIHDKDSDFHGDVAYGGNADKMTGNPLQRRYELMQYTGMNDKNGKEIYDGDIVYSQRGYKFVVEWTDDGRFLGRTANRSIAYVGQEPAVEVIGNIHDNPELMRAGH